VSGSHCDLTSVVDVSLLCFQALGRVGKVVKVYSDGDMRVCVAAQTWTFNPLCCVPRPQDQQQIDNTKSSEENPGCSKSGAVANTEGKSGYVSGGGVSEQ